MEMHKTKSWGNPECRCLSNHASYHSPVTPRMNIYKSPSCLCGGGGEALDPALICTSWRGSGGKEEFVLMLCHQAQISNLLTSGGPSVDSSIL